MIDLVTRVLDDSDMEFAEILIRLGASRNVAMMITYLKNVPKATSREIELGAELRQPEVSIGVRTLRQNDWITEMDVKGEGKGRPSKEYRLRVPIDEIIKHYEDIKRREAERTMQSIERLKTLKNQVKKAADTF
jgi:predicted transcriptional regulator